MAIKLKHNNPVTGKWMLAEDFVEYEHSSASFYKIQLVRRFRPAPVDL